MSCTFAPANTALTSVHDFKKIITVVWEAWVQCPHIFYKKSAVTVVISMQMRNGSGWIHAIRYYRISCDCSLQKLWEWHVNRCSSGLAVKQRFVGSNPRKCVLTTKFITSSNDLRPRLRLLLFRKPTVLFDSS